ncbi:MAG TPA: hypothetical protein VFZ66_03635 [Herpetosiphonaceae bacterium]
MRYRITGPITSPDAIVTEELQRLLAHAGTVTISTVLVGPPYKPTPYVAWVIEVPDAVAELVTTKVFPIVLGRDGAVQPIAAIPDRPEWTIRALLHPTADAQPLLDLDTFPWASISVQLHWKPGRCAGLVRASAEDREHLRLVRERGWTATQIPPQIPAAAAKLARPVRLRAYGGAPWLGPRSAPSASLPAPVIPAPAAPSVGAIDAGSADRLTPPSDDHALTTTTLPDMLAAPGAPGLLLGVQPDGSGVTLAWHALTLALDAPLARQRHAVLALLRRAFAQGMGVLAILPHPLLTDGLLAPWATRIRLLDGRDLWASAAIPWHALDRDVLQTILQMAGARLPLPDLLPEQFAPLLAQVGLAELATDAVNGLTARPGDDLAGVLLAGGGVVLADQGNGAGDLLANLVLAACAPAGQGDRPLLIIRPAALAVPEVLGTRAIQLVLGTTAAHATIRAVEDGWHLESGLGGAAIRVSADLTAEPAGLDLALHTSLVTTLDGPEHQTAAGQDDADAWYAGQPTTVERAAVLPGQAHDLPVAIATEDPVPALDVPAAAPVIPSWEAPTPAATSGQAAARITNAHAPAVGEADLPDALMMLAADPFLGLSRDDVATTERDTADPVAPALVDAEDGFPAHDTGAIVDSGSMADAADLVGAADDAVHLADATMNLHDVSRTLGATPGDAFTPDLLLDDQPVDRLLEAAPLGGADAGAALVLTDLASLDHWDVALLDPNEMTGGDGDLPLDDLLFVGDDATFGFDVPLDAVPVGDDPLVPDASLLAAIAAFDEPLAEPPPDLLLVDAPDLFPAVQVTRADAQLRERDPAHDDLLLVAATDAPVAQALPLDDLTRQGDETGDTEHHPVPRRSLLAVRPRRRWTARPASRRDGELVAAAPMVTRANGDQQYERDLLVMPPAAAADLAPLPVVVDDPTDAAPLTMTTSAPDDESSIMGVTSSDEADVPCSPVLEGVFSPPPASGAESLLIPNVDAADVAGPIGGDDSGSTGDADDSVALPAGARLCMGDMTLDGAAIWTRWRSGTSIPAIVRDLAAQQQLDPRALRIAVKALIDRSLAERRSAQPVPTPMPPTAPVLGDAPNGEDPSAHHAAPASAGQPTDQVVAAGAQPDAAFLDEAGGDDTPGVLLDAVAHAADDLPATVVPDAETSARERVLVEDDGMLTPEAAPLPPAAMLPDWPDARIWTTWQAGTGIPALVRQIAAACPDRDPTAIRQVVKAVIDRHLDDRKRAGVSQASAGAVQPLVSRPEPLARVQDAAGSTTQAANGLGQWSSSPPIRVAPTELSPAADGASSAEAHDVAAGAASASGLTAHSDDDAIWAAWQASVPLPDMISDLSGFERGAQAETARERIYQVVVPHLVDELAAWDIVERVVANRKPLRAQQERYEDLLRRMNRQRYPVGGAVHTKTHDRLVRIMRAELAKRVAV